jgi:Na+-driven multidrug efflux pump
VAGTIGKEVQAAYGLVAQIYFICIVIANALTVGTVSVIARLFTDQGPGAKDKLTTAIFSSIVTAALAGLIVLLVGTLSIPHAVGLLNVPGDLKGYLLPLSRIYLVGIFFHYLLINGNGILRSCQMVRKSLRTMAFVCGCNILLIFLFVYHTQLGYRGIALATATSVTLGSLLNLRYLRILMPAFKRLLGSREEYLAIGWPMGLLQILWQLGSVAPSFDPEHARAQCGILAAFTAGMRIESVIFFLPSRSI